MYDPEYWKLCEQLNVVQAALLMSGHDPSEFEQWVEDWDIKNQPDGYHPCKVALIAAIKCGSLKGNLANEIIGDPDGDYGESVNLRSSFVAVQSLTDWLVSKQFRCAFFRPNEEPEPSYLDSTHIRFAPKLAAAVKAWEAAGEGRSFKGRPKQFVEKWLRLHASEYCLTLKNGKPNESAIKAIARITNWKPEGGAPATEVATTQITESATKSGSNIVKLKQVVPTKSSAAFELDDEIPF